MVRIDRAKNRLQLERNLLTFKLNGTCQVEPDRWDLTGPTTYTTIRTSDGL